MKLSNFQLKEVRGNSILDIEYFAEVDVETGFLFFKKTTRKLIRREYLKSWHFVDSGKYLPRQIEDLALAWTAKTGQRF